MVRIIDTVQRENADGESFYAFIVMGGLEAVTSTNGKVYMTARKASVPTTFDEQTAKSFIGSSISGAVQKVETDEPYDYTTESGEVIQLSHRWTYVSQPTTEDAVFEHQVEQPL